MFFQFIFNRRIIALKYCVFYQSYISMHQPYVYICSLPHDRPSHLPPQPTLWVVTESWFSLSPTTNLHWLSILHMVMYMFPCYSLHLFHPLRVIFIHRDMTIVNIRQIDIDGWMDRQVDRSKERRERKRKSKQILDFNFRYLKCHRMDHLDAGNKNVPDQFKQKQKRSFLKTSKNILQQKSTGSIARPYTGTRTAWKCCGSKSEYFSLHLFLILGRCGI